jgi:hypothetical protein
MTPSTISFIAFVVTIVIALGLLGFAIMHSYQREILIAASALVGAASAAFLTESLTLWDRRDADEKAAYVMLNNYALHRLKAQHDATKSYVQWYHDHWADAVNDFGKVNLHPLLLYDELLRNERLPQFVPRSLFDYLADAMADEEELLEKVGDDHQSAGDRLSALELYRDLVARSWSEICVARNTILKVDESGNVNSCKIEPSSAPKQADKK